MMMLARLGWATVTLKKRDTTKWEKRERVKRKRRQHGEDGRSVKLLELLIGKRAKEEKK